MKKILILGGDRRQKELFSLLTSRELDCTSVFEGELLNTSDFIRGFDVIILPVPFSKDGKNLFSENAMLKISLSDIISGLEPGKHVIGGSFSESFLSLAKENGAKTFDLLGERDFALFNAYLTAQGAVRLLLENTEDYVVSKRALVTGFGKVGKATAHFLSSLGLDVYVFARRSEIRTHARALGYKTISETELSQSVHLFDFIFNTVPKRLFEKEDVLHMKNRAVYFELASAPFGADKENFEKAKATFVFGGGLPGRFCSFAAAKEIEKRIDRYFEKPGDTLD